MPGLGPYLLTDLYSLYLEIPRCKSPLFRDLSSLFDSARSLNPMWVSFFFYSSIDFKLSSSVISSLSLFFSISRISLCFLTCSSYAISSSFLSSLLSCLVTLSFSATTFFLYLASSPSSSSSIFFCLTSSSSLEGTILPPEVTSVLSFLLCSLPLSNIVFAYTSCIGCSGKSSGPCALREFTMSV